MATAPGFPVSGVKHYGKITAVQGTPIIQLIEPWYNLHTIVSYFEYEYNGLEDTGTGITLGSSHTLTGMRPIGRTTLASAITAGASTATLVADPGNFSSTQVADNPPAANDYMVINLDDGSFYLGFVSNWNDGTKVVTFSTTIPYAAAIGRKVWFYGLPTDTNPTDARAHPTWTLKAQADNTILGQNEPYGFFGTLLVSDPLLLYSDNEEAAGEIVRCTAMYTARGGQLGTFSV